MKINKLFLCIVSLALLAGCVNADEFKAETNAGAQFLFTADACGLFYNQTLVACRAGDQWVFQDKWDDVKHFHNLTQDRIDEQRKALEAQAKSNQSGGGGSDSIVGDVLFLHLFGII